MVIRPPQTRRIPVSANESPPKSATDLLRLFTSSRSRFWTRGTLDPATEDYEPMREPGGRSNPFATFTDPYRDVPRRFGTSEALQSDQDDPRSRRSFLTKRFASSRPAT
jgi:hypothetical protein